MSEEKAVKEEQSGVGKVGKIMMVMRSLSVSDFVSFCLYLCGSSFVCLGRARASF